MARNPDLDATLGQVDEATNRIGASAGKLSTAVDGVSTRVFALTELIKTRMTDEEVAQVKAALDSETNRLDTVSAALDVMESTLNGIAADSSNPVPEPTPIPEPTPEPTPGDGGGGETPTP